VVRATKVQKTNRINVNYDYKTLPKRSEICYSCLYLPEGM